MNEQTKTAAAGIALILCGFMIAALSVLSAHNRKLEEERMNDKRAAVIDSLKRENKNERAKATEHKKQVSDKEIEVD